MAAVMQKTCSPCLPTRSAALRLSIHPARVAVRAQASPVNASFEVARAVGLVTAASSLLVAGSADAAVEISQLAAADNRIGILATLFVPALGWVGFNIGQPLLSQLGRMDEMAGSPAKKSIKRSFAAAVGLSAAALMLADSASAATEVAQLAGTDNRVLILAIVFVPVVGWVGFNIAQPLLSQFGRMSSKLPPAEKKVSTKKVAAKKK